MYVCAHWISLNPWCKVSCLTMGHKQPIIGMLPTYTPQDEPLVHGLAVVKQLSRPHPRHTCNAPGRMENRDLGEAQQWLDKLDMIPRMPYVQIVQWNVSADGLRKLSCSRLQGLQCHLVARCPFSIQRVLFGSYGWRQHLYLCSQRLYCSRCCKYT